MSKNVKRLYKSFQPEHYDLQIEISEDKQTFKGSVVITGKKVGRPSKRITLHQKNLQLTHVTMQSVDKKGDSVKVPISRTVLHKTYNELRIHADDVLYPGAYVIECTFNGTITNNMDGIYPCFYEIAGISKQLIATQFESHHAREVFPCVDEPEAKATFKTTLIHDTHETALSNTPLKAQQAVGKRTQSQFEITPLMSTYLLAFVVGELSYREKTSKNGIKIRTYAVENQIEHSTFALDVAVQAMDFYEEYYDIPFPLNKCDFVALPDFASGAMENWGLITFREQTLLCDPQTSLGTKQYVAIVVAHELTHQWFGNLVTMRWWTDLWLNEGFASWMEYLAVNSIFPEWDLWTQFAVDEQQAALKADALEHTHPIEVPVHHPDEIRTIFDIISYQKGASVIHMLHDYLGAEPFRDGLRHYLKSYAYKNAETKDLWSALEEITGKPIVSFMQGWTSKSGYPLVSVENRNNHLTITQTKFVTNPASPARQDTTLWQVPLLCDELSTTVISKKRTTIPYDDHPPIQINENQTGFYRVRYDETIQHNQMRAIETGSLSEIDRMSLLSDGFEITRAGYQPIVEYLTLLSHFKNESSLPVWEIIAGSLGSIRQTLSATDTDDTLRDLMKPFISALTAKQLTTLGWEKRENEKHLETLLRPLIIALSAGADDKSTTAKLLDLYRQRIAHDAPIDPDIRATVYGTAARLGGEKEFNELLSLYKASLSSDEKLSLTAAMTSFEDTRLHERVLELLLDGTVRMQDVGYWIAYSFMNRHSRMLTWEWLQKNWPWLKKNMGSDLSFHRMPIYAARQFATKELETAYTSFFTEHMEPALQRSYVQGLEMVQTNISWRERDSEQAVNWFKAQQK